MFLAGAGHEAQTLFEKLCFRASSTSATTSKRCSEVRLISDRQGACVPRS